MSSNNSTDLGCHGTVTADLFCVEIQYTDGTTGRIGANYRDFFDAEDACERIEHQIESGERPDSFTAYVVAVECANG